MTEILKYPINILSESAEFKISILLPSEEKVRWLPIMPCGRRPDFCIGILENGDWVAEVRQGLRNRDRCSYDWQSCFKHSRCA